MRTQTRAVASEKETLARISKGLRMVTVPLPHLIGLANAVDVYIDDRIPSMGVFASGRMVANRGFVARLNDSELVFVLAHELLHLALRTHDRSKGSGRLEFNYAHDYIINDILRVELGFTSIPAGGLDMPGAREKSAEQIVLEFRKGAAQMQSQSRVWEGKAVGAVRVFGAKHQRTGKPSEGEGEPADGELAGDVLGETIESEWFPESAEDQAERAAKIGELAAKSLALAKAMAAMRVRGTDSGATRQVITAIRGYYRTPWESALQKWMESVSPGERTFLRPSRRSAERPDIVLPGRKRDSWMLNILLDTSGSMTDDIPRVLGAIAVACDAMGIDHIRLIQCDAEIKSDETLSPDELAQYEVSGFGGSELSPAMLTLADDPAATPILLPLLAGVQYDLAIAKVTIVSTGVAYALYHRKPAAP